MPWPIVEVSLIEEGKATIVVVAISKRAVMRRRSVGLMVGKYA
jgi:hypothetical protein